MENNQTAEKEKSDELLTKYQEGMKKGLELSKELPTWDDVRKAIHMVREIKYVTYSEDEIIEQLKQSKK